MQQVDVSGIGNFNHKSLNEVPQHVEKSVHQAKEIVVSTTMNTSEDVDDSLAIMLDKDLNKGRGTCSKENWNMVIHRKASSNVSPAIKPPIVTLNTLAHEVPTQFLEPFRELQGESRQLILSKGNDKDLVKGMSSLSQANLTNNLIISKENQGERSAPSVIAKKNEVEALASGVNPTNAYAIDLGDDSFDEDEEDNILDECFDKVARDGDISPRHQRSGSNKSKRKTHGRQHNWDGKVIGEFVQGNYL
ncbi:hypothetical protein MTR67_000486 [Solanum verrucosum]|uniref:NB-ARC domain containing protein n=1 Tax=Solanum verrucosum TaxID=315347 RepID=A0AAF0T6L2_SOLVR|nr:hypothetical protein MTR67_000486 [Solanum verrucosum]